MPTPDATRQKPAFLGGAAPNAAQTRAAAAAAIIPPAESTSATLHTTRIVEFGIECRRTLEWQPGWEPGGKYIRKLILKNMLSHTLRIDYTLPTSGVFLAAYPDTITLSPGMTYSIVITFQPWANEDYLDKVEIVAPSGRFSVHLVARFQKAELIVPSCVDMGNCTVQEITEKTFSISNEGKRPVSFRWKSIGAPFELIPQTGWVDAGGSEEIRVRICPDRALRFVITAVCVCGEGSAFAHVRLVAISKYPYLQASRRVLDFGPVMCGVKAERDITLMNTGPVHATCHIEADDSSSESHHRRHGDPSDDIAVLRPPISLIPPRVSLSPGQHATLKCKYTPHVSGHTDLRRFSLSTAAGTHIRITCRGQSVGPQLSIHPACIDFESVEVDREVVRVLTITNLSDEAAPYQLWTAPLAGVFRFDSNCAGILARHASVQIAVRFTPREACTYIKRVLLFVKDGNPSLVSIIATAYDSKTRPVPLKLDHVLEYERRVLARSDSATVANKEGETGPSGGEIQMVGENEQNEWGNSCNRLPLSAWNVALSNTISRADIVKLNKSFIDFGECSRLRPPPHQIIQLSNQTQAKVCCHWTVGKVFQVFPERAEIAPADAASFRISFRPPHDGSFFEEMLECTAVLKSMRSFQTITQESFVPPVTLPLQVLAHTFTNGLRTFPPKASVSAAAIGAQPLIFPSCGPGEKQPTTVTLFNNCETPLRFDAAVQIKGTDSNSDQRALHDDGDVAFSCHPCQGVITGQSLQIFALQFAPKSPQLYKGKLVFKLNLGRETVEVNLRGQCAEPVLTIEARAAEKSDADATLSSDPSTASPDICFRPTSIDLASSVVRVLRNTSPVRCRFRLESVVDKTQVNEDWNSEGPGPIKEVTVTPSEGVLEGLDGMELRWEFAPRQIRRYKLQASILYSCAPSAEAEVQQQSAQQRSLTISLTGLGTAGALSFDTATDLRFGEVLLGKRTRRCLRILNRSYTDVPFRLSCQLSSQELASKGEKMAEAEQSPLSPDEGIQNAVAFSPDQGVVPARCEGL